MSESRGHSVRAGQILVQRYCIQRLIGEGGVGAVFLAEDLELHRPVAVKVPKRSLFGDQLATERFRREIRATMAISCDYVVRTLGVGALDNGVPFMVMEFHAARDLAHAIAERGPLPIELALEFALQICVALAHAHRLGIVHRDIKPANLLLVPLASGREQIKVLDFGISKFASDVNVSTHERLTGNAVRLGSPLYMSPEQRNFARDVDQRADIWSLGITLFEMIAGVVPFDSSPQSIRGELELPSTVPSLSRSRSGSPPQLDWVIARCLQRVPALRFHNVAELASALVSFAPPSLVPLAREASEVLGPEAVPSPASLAAGGLSVPLDGLRRETTVVSSAASLGHSGIDVAVASVGLRPGTTLGPAAIGLSRGAASTIKPHFEARWWSFAVLLLALVVSTGTFAYYEAMRVRPPPARALTAMPNHLRFVREARTPLRFHQNSTGWTPSLREPSVQTARPAGGSSAEPKLDLGY